MRTKQVIVVRTDLEMSRGKIAVQVAHAACGAVEEARKKCPDLLKIWEKEGSKKVVVEVKSEEELMKIYEEAKSSGLACYLVRDAGLTEIPPGTATAVAVGPDLSERIDKITGGLKLLR